MFVPPDRRLKAGYRSAPMVSRRPPEADAYHFRTNDRSELTVFQPKDLRAPTADSSNSCRWASCRATQRWAAISALPTANRAFWSRWKRVKEARTDRRSVDDREAPPGPDAPRGSSCRRGRDNADQSLRRIRGLTLIAESSRLTESAIPDLEDMLRTGLWQSGKCRDAQHREYKRA
jgi:hypothetical protein